MILTMMQRLLAGDFSAYMSRGSAAERKGAKLAGKRLIAHRKRWKKTPKMWESRPHKPAPIGKMSRQVRRRLLRQQVKKLARRDVADALIALKIKHGIIGKTKGKGAAA